MQNIWAHIPSIHKGVLSTNMYLYGLENRENCLSLKLSLDPAFYCDENDMVQFHFA